MTTEEEQQQQQHNAEIWSSRVQRELLALTTDDADFETTDEVRSMIPPFVRVLKHVLELETGTCVVDFEIQIATQTDQSGESSSRNVVVVQIDASLPRLPDGSINSSTACYPFTAPIVRLASGQECFPQGSTIQNGNAISIDLDWTPSLHLTDAIMNISLKVKESILQGEGFHPAPEPVQGDGNDDELTRGARRIASSITKGATSLTKAFSPQARRTRKPKQNNKKRSEGPKTPDTIKIGDEINVLEDPWVAAHGFYSCKAIRRPPFVTEAIEKAQVHEEQKAFQSPTAMFRSFAKSARGVLEEHFLMITETHIIELRANKLQPANGTVVFCIPIGMMAKLKFRRQESLSLFFKTAPDEPLIYMCPDSGDAVHQIQSVLRRHGVKGKHTNAAAYRAINEAMQLVQEIQTKELALKHDPSVERVNDIMDLYRQAAERFEAAGDLRHEEVVTHMRKFLALPLTVSILDGSYTKAHVEASPSPTRKDGVPEGEVLERTDAQINDDDLDGSDSKEHEKANDRAFEENMDNLLKEAKADLEKLKMEDDSTLDTEGTASGDLDTSALAEVAADLDAMMKEADKELSELMNT